MFFPRARRVKTVNLDAVFARAAYKRPSATLVGNCQLGSLTTGSPAGHLRERGFKGEHGFCEADRKIFGESQAVIATPT